MMGLMMSEGNAVARSVGIDLKTDPQAELERVRSNLAQQPSMLQDVRAGRPIEFDAIMNAVVEMAHLTGVPVPTLKSVAAMLDVLNAGIIRQGQGIGFQAKQ